MQFNRGFKSQCERRSRIQVNGKKRSLGCFTEKSDAIAARAAAEIEHNFHENHGRCGPRDGSRKPKPKKEPNDA